MKRLSAAAFPGLFLAGALAVSSPIPAAPAVAAGPGKVGVVVMHGKGGSPDRLVAPLADALAGAGYRVRSLEMPWSKNRRYDVDVAAAEAEVTAALGALRKAGAGRLFVAGHSQGAVFAAHFAGRHPLDGLILIAPGGNVANRVFRRELGEAVARAKAMIDAGRGAERAADGAPFLDFEGSQGASPVPATARIYFSWFDPAGAMNQLASTRQILPATPVLHVAPTDDYKGLRRVRQDMFALLPSHPRTRLYEPEAGHKDAPGAAAGEIIRWIAAVAAAPEK